jgi:hypothetical protein
MTTALSRSATSRPSSGKSLVKAVRDGSGYFTDILGDTSKDLIGLLIGDRVKAKRIERIAMLWQRTRERLHDAPVLSLPQSRRGVESRP